MEYEEMVDKVVNTIGVTISSEDKALVVKNLNVVNGIVKVLNDGKEDHDLRSTQVIAFIIQSTLMEMYASGRIQIPESA